MKFLADQSPLREAEHKALSSITLTGSVLDLGGDARSYYQKCFKGEYHITTLNYDPKSGADIVHDLEKPLPEIGKFDAVLAINVLEHIYNARRVVEDAYRVLNPGGTMVIAVPFLFPVHPSPQDYWRFTSMTLEKMMKEVGFRSVECKALGNGVFDARSLMLQRLLPKPLRIIHRALLLPLSRANDWFFAKIARSQKKLYHPADYALGYVVRAIK